MKGHTYMGTNWAWILSAITVFIGIIGADRWMQKKIDAGDNRNSDKIDKVSESISCHINSSIKTTNEKIDASSRIVHERIDRAGSEFVRREELKSLVEMLIQSQKEGREEQRATNIRLDKALELLISNNNTKA